jgi:4-hydroxy-tetrahydrodipicolinate synthase
MTDLSGLIPIVPTPFDRDAAVDPPALAGILDYLIEVGVHGVAVLGMASEAITLTDGERDQLISTAAERVDGRLPIVAGCSHNSPQAVTQLAKAADRCGADALMVMPPVMGKPDRTALRDYFVAAADASGLPVMIQDNPGWHGVNLPVEMYAELAEHPNIRYAKIETQHPPTTMAAVRAIVDDRLGLFGGQAGVWLPEELRRGIIGTMPAAIMPQVYLLIWQLWQEGRREAAIAVFDHYYPLIRVSGTPRVGIPMAKVVLRAAGVIDNDAVRAPFPALSEADRNDLDAVLTRLKIIDVMRGESALFDGLSVPNGDHAVRIE